MNDRIAELETARLSCEADEDATLRLQEKLARLRATVAQTRCGSPPGQDRSQGQGQGKGQGQGQGRVAGGGEPTTPAFPLAFRSVELPYLLLRSDNQIGSLSRQRSAVQQFRTLGWQRRSRRAARHSGSESPVSPVSAVSNSAASDVTDFCRQMAF